MDPAAGQPVVTDNEAQSRFEMHAGGQLAGFVQYHRRGRLIHPGYLDLVPEARRAEFGL